MIMLFVKYKRIFSDVMSYLIKVNFIAILGAINYFKTGSFVCHANHFCVYM